MSDNPAFDQIKSLVSENDVFLFMKGDPTFPQCGFSSVVSQVLMHLGVKFQSFNVLSDMEIREGIKAYSDWPTIPQLYVKGEFVGGCDIVKEMFESGELQQLLKDNNLIEA
ncbi:MULTISPECIES: Grx4 family monothiol glutaredoxin [Kordiimonas]|uniref:Grx4 family monothiol glutaredoxin n=1 Tax=Kordiimonas TaxID=288021 RepID=UPI001FF30733|nr:MULTISPECIES: Grx4 family monothiol glutaredoxin [Kordiimonas]MCK0069642.1 Grx4 family monothiol glutaredoxin [Kordiimonas laminariae]UTW57106.1 Grx4 family monothiol glutaredoxin [Kordiimonas sp. SCSIO 12603]